MFNSFVSLSSHLFQALFRVLEQLISGLFTLELLLKLLMLLQKEVERILQVLVAVHEHLVVLIQIVHEVFHEE